MGLWLIFFTVVLSSHLGLAEAVASSQAGRALVLQQGHPLSPLLLHPSLLLGRRPDREVTPTSRIARYKGGSGLVITGGRGAETDKSIETFTKCTIPPFPLGRLGHSLSVTAHGSQLVACGGYWPWTATSCISWRHGQEGWKDYHTMSKERLYHAAVVLQDSIVIVGGWRNSSRTTGEIVPGGTEFPLHNSGMATCAVKFQRALVMIGGGSARDSDLHGKVDRYDSQGNHLGSLPDLGTARGYHACATFVSSAGEEGLLVAGGSEGTNKDDGLSSTEVYLPSKGRWTSGGTLPRRLFGLAAAHLNQQVVVIGGDDVEGNRRDEVLEYNGLTWSERKERLEKGRANHAIVEANLSSFCPAKGSLCPSPIPPTPGQPCTLPGELDCHYEYEHEQYEHDCCGRCVQQFSCVSDNSTSGAGLWKMSSSPPCPADCCGSQGVVTSPNYPNNYPNYLNKTDTIQVEEGLIISLQFTEFNIESHSTCRYDHLTITDGDGTTLMEKRCGSTIPADIRSTSNIVKLVFITDSTGWSTGWSLSWSAVTPGSEA